MSNNPTIIVRERVIEKRTPPTVIILHETLRQSIVSDLVTFVVLCAATLVGIYLQSAALQLIAGIMALITLVTMRSRKTRKLTIEQARDRLDEIEHQFMGRTNETR